MSTLTSGDILKYTIDKYNRLDDKRNNPLVVEKQPHETMQMVFNFKLNILSVVHNSRKLEEFNVISRTNPHEMIQHQARVLIVVKNQINGSTENKFRVRFPSNDDCQNFCSVLSQFLKVVQYDDWYKNASQSSNMSIASFSSQKQASQSQSSGSVVARNSNFRSYASFPNNSSSVPNVFNEYTQNPTPPSIFSDKDANSTGIILSQESLPSNACTQTQPLVTDSGSPVININIQNMFSEEIMNRFLGTCESLANAIFASISIDSNKATKGPQGTKKRGRAKKIT